MTDDKHIPTLTDVIGKVKNIGSKKNTDEPKIKNKAKTKDKHPIEAAQEFGLNMEQIEILQKLMNKHIKNKIAKHSNIMHQELSEEINNILLKLEKK